MVVSKQTECLQEVYQPCNAIPFGVDLFPIYRQDFQDLQMKSRMKRDRYTLRNIREENVREHSEMMLRIIKTDIEIRTLRQRIKAMDSRAAAKRRSEEMSALQQRHQLEENEEKAEERSSSQALESLRAKQLRIESDLSSL